MSNEEFQGKYVHFNVVHKSGETDQWMASKPLVHEIAPHHIMTTPHETGLTSPPNERHIPLYQQESSWLSRQKHAQQTYTSHVTTYQYLSSNIIPNQECSPTSYYIYSWSDTILAPNATADPSHQQSKESSQNDVETQQLHQQMLNQSQLNDTLGSNLNSQQSLQRESMSMMNEMSKRHENEQFICDFQMFNGKNMDFDEWIAQIEKVSNLTGKPEYILALAKSSGTPYKMIFQTPSKTAWSELKRKLPEVYSSVATDVHVATDLLRKQHANELLQDYIAYWTEMCH